MQTSNQAEFAASLFNPDAPLPAGIMTARGAADPRRFDVYRNNVVASLIGALEQQFPVTCRLVGDDFFRQMARAYVAVSKPSSPLIFQYGDKFPQFVAECEAARRVPYLADIARLETLWTRAYHAADAAPLDAARLCSIEPGALPLTSFAPHPAASVLRSQWPVGSIWEAHQHDPVVPPKRWEPETLLVARPGMEVKIHRLPSHDGGFAEALMSGATIGEAASAAADDTRFDFGRAITGLISLGSFRDLSTSPATRYTESTR